MPVLYGFSCEDLVFEGNRIFKSYHGKPWHPGKAMIALDSCRNVRIAGNAWVGDFRLERLSQKGCQMVDMQE